MRINKFIAMATGISRRAADDTIAEGRVKVNGRQAQLGQTVSEIDKISFNNKRLDFASLTAPESQVTIMLNKPFGYVVSRQGQGNKTIYDLLPPEYQLLKPVGRLDRNSSGLLIMTSDGQLAYELTHPSKQKTKVYQVTLNKALTPADQRHISDHGVMLEDGLSRLLVVRLPSPDNKQWSVTMHEGRNRQIRRTFEVTGYKVIKLHRTQFGDYSLGSLGFGDVKKF
ncbi:MAG: pseudouridine synthase [Candidatus Saccharimonadales bacterium]